MYLERNPKSYHKTRTVWYQEAIIDFMIANPGAKISEIAAYVNRAPGTVSSIINADMFKAALEARRRQFVQTHDLSLLHKTQKLADASLDALLSVVGKKKDAVPLQALMTIHSSAMDRLGYGVPKDPQSIGGPTVNVNVGGQNAVVAVQVSPEDLAQARMAIRQVQQQRLEGPRPQTIEATVVAESASSEDGGS